MQGLLHTVLSGANIGILVLATAAFAVRFFMGSRDDNLAASADKVAYVAAAVGVILAIFTALSGIFGTWPREAIRETLLIQNKMLVASALIGSWGMFVLLRWRVGPKLWQNSTLKLWSAFLVLVGFLNTVLVGSMGGSASLKGTILDPVLWSLNLNRFTSLSWGPVLSVVVIVVVLALAVFTGRKRASS
ncbi:MAG: hypothetical protein IPM39_12000 [Chloroflexi bacterium]|nr:hypothetical protein [Chloroflexota bacterium]